MKHRPALAYLFERFPSFTQTFCFREVRELDRQGMPPLIHAIRATTDEPPQDYPAGFSDSVVHLPDPDTLVAETKQARTRKTLYRPIRKTLEAWTSKQDRHRVYEAAWLGPRLRKAGIRHVHAHFAGIAARTAYWLKRFYGISYSFTGHANDLYCPEPGLPVSLADLIQEAALVVTVSDHTRAELAALHPATGARRIRRVYNGIDTRLWTPSDGPRTSPPAIVSVGRLIEKKGFADLIRASARLRRLGVAHHCRIIGEGPLQAELETLIRTEDCGDSVQLAGPRTQDQIREELRAATLFALPCVHESDGGRDVLPTVLMEAMACGLPCISTAVAGVPELVSDGRTGLIIPEHQPEALAGAIRSLIEAPDRAAGLGAAGRAAAESVYDIRITTRDLKHLLVRHGRIRPTARAAKLDPALWRSWLAGWLAR